MVNKMTHKRFRDGFITAIGTPLDNNGNLIKESFKKHIDDQIKANISGILCMGSMGKQATIKNDVFAEVAETAVDCINSAVPIIVGCMDNSIERVKDRIELIKKIKLDGIALTTPFYHGASQKDLLRFFTQIADYSPFPIYLYDLPQVTKIKIEIDTVVELSKHPNIFGIKCSHDPAYVRKLYDHFKENQDFDIISAQVDLMDVFYRYGLKLQLDGIFCLFPEWMKELKNSIDKSNWRKAAYIQQRITSFRDKLLKLDVSPAFSYGMNLLGYKGNFAPDYCKLEKENKDKVCKLMKEYGLT
ncbi:MAG: dihydrodipicolinate synthase family protein [bacterium]|nr:dihydrodipicolinate synthase family protein [bacterium]